jgi:hypothetical protein
MNSISSPELRHIKHAEIDRGLWDKVVGLSANSRVYAFSWYLDRVSERWEALVWGDYEFVMPLTARRKWGLSYLYTPAFCQQLGIFPIPEKSIQQLFFKWIRQHYRYIQIQVNSGLDPEVFEGFDVTIRDNYILPLFGSYQTVSSGYSKHTVRNLSRAVHAGITTVKGMNASDFIQAKNALNKSKVNKSTYASLERIIAFVQSEGSGNLYGAYSRHNELCAAALFLRSGSRAVYLSAFSTEEGKETRAMYAIVDRFIRDGCRTGMLLDFEGSSMPGIARFYKGFGAHLENYYHLYHNNLPFPLNRLK